MKQKPICHEPKTFFVLLRPRAIKIGSLSKEHYTYGNV